MTKDTARRLDLATSTVAAALGWRDYETTGALRAYHLSDGRDVLIIADGEYRTAVYLDDAAAWAESDALADDRYAALCQATEMVDPRTLTEELGDWGIGGIDGDPDRTAGDCYQVDVEDMTVTHDGSSGVVDLNAEGEPCQTIEDLCAFVDDLHEQGAYDNATRDRLLEDIDRASIR